MSQITLLPFQERHVKQLQDFLSQRPFAFDFSLMGSGKTFTSTKLAFEGQFAHVIVVCPNSVIPKWNAMKTLASDVPFRACVSYQSLRSTTFHQPKHKLLHRFESPTVLNRSTPEFTPTDLYKSYVKEGLLLILDEVQNIKNFSSQYLAAQALISELMSTTNSKVLLLSASPIDKREQAVRIFRTLGVLTRPLAYWNPQTFLMDWAGLNDVVRFCQSISQVSTDATPQRTSREVNFESYVYRLFLNVIKTHCSSTMKVEKHATTLTKCNAYYHIDAEGEKILLRGMSSLTTATRFENGHVNMQGEDAVSRISSVVRALQVIETGKISLFARLVQKYADENPYCKIVVAVNYCETLNDLCSLLQSFHPLLLQGSTSVKQRASVLEKFAAPSLDHRVLLCNQSVASTGIDLDDKHGKYPRLCLVSPNYSSITAFQLGHRFHRLDTRSDARVHFVFALRPNSLPAQCQDIIELKVLDSLSRKSEIMRATCDSSMIPDVQFPGDHQDYIEQ
jgi:hypothetical protein